MSTTKTKREMLHEYLTRPETPEDIKEAWLELDHHVATLTRDLQMEMIRRGDYTPPRAGEEG
jgi:hypothetical protein